MKIYFVRATEHPGEDLKRGWTAPPQGSHNRFFTPCATIEEARHMWSEYYCHEEGLDYEELNPFYEYEWGWHEKYGGFVEIQWEGLAGFNLHCDNIDEALRRVDIEYVGREKELVSDEQDYELFLPCCTVSYHKTSSTSLWVFEVEI